MYNFREKIDTELDNIRRLMEYYADDFERIAEMGPRGSLLLKQGKRSAGVTIQREAEHTDGVRHRERRSLGAICSDEALSFARDDYLAKLKCILTGNARVLEKLRRGYQSYDVDSVLKSLSIAANVIIKQAGGYGFLYGSESVRPARSSSYSDSIGNKRWGDDRFDHSKRPQCVAASGQIVNSKGEVIIDILLDHYAVPHDYEKKIELRDENGFKLTRVPDFTLYCGNEIIYWEHFGMLDKDGYLLDNAKKIQLYNRNGIVLWDNLLVTTDGPKGAVNAEAMDWLIRSYILPRMRR